MTGQRTVTLQIPATVDAGTATVIVQAAGAAGKPAARRTVKVPPLPQSFTPPRVQARSR